MNYFIIAYHNIVDSNSTNMLSGIDQGVFYNQIKTLSKAVSFITVKEFIINFTENRLDDSDYCTITIDDGLRGVIEFGLPILQEFEALATLYISSYPYINKKILQAHKINMLRKELHDKDFCEEVDRIAKKLNISIDKIVDKVVNCYPLLYRYDNLSVRRIKTFLNYGAPFSMRDAVLNILFCKLFGEEGDYIEELYMSPKDIQQASGIGFEVGCHSHSHEMLSRLSVILQSADISRCVEYLYSITGNIPVSFSYPFGHAGTFCDSTISLLRSMGFIGAVMVNRAIVPSAAPDLFRLPRFDAKDLFDTQGNFLTTAVRNHA